MKRFATSITALALLVIGQEYAHGQTNVYSSNVVGPGIKSIDIIPVDNSSVPALSGFVTQDIVVTFEGELRSNQIYLELDQGTVYRDAVAVGDVNPPNSALIGAFPSLEFNTFYGIGGRTLQEQSLIAEMSTTGGAVDLGGAATAAYTDVLLNQNWFPNPGEVISDATDFFLARITLSSDAEGAWRFTTWAEGPGGEPRVFLNDDSKFVVYAGQVTIVPEPSAILIASCGVAGVAVLRRRRKAARA